MKPTPIITAFLLSYSAISSAQNECKDALYNANKLYESGQIKQAIDILEPCIEKGLAKEAKFDAYHLLAMAYQNLNESEKADQYVRLMLKQKPDYQKFSSIDPLEFTKLVNSYSVSPKLYAGLSFGVNFTSVKLEQSYSVYESKQRYNPSTGYQFGVLADYRLKPDISLSADLQLSGLTVDHEIDDAGGWSQRCIEEQRYFLMSLSGRKHFKITKNIQATAGIGFGAGLMNKANINMEATNSETSAIQLSTKDALEERNKFQPFVSGIVGIAYTSDRGILSLEMNYSMFLKTTVNADKRMNDLNFIFNNQYVNDDINLRTSLISISYRVPVVWRIKLKE